MVVRDLTMFVMFCLGLFLILCWLVLTATVVWVFLIFLLW